MGNFKSKYLHPLKIRWIETKIKLFGPWRYFLMQEQGIEKRICKQYYKNNYHTTGGVPRYVVFVCNGFSWHGGLADRLKAICSLYTWCKDNNQSFKIHFVNPFILSDYLHPNKYSWTIQADKVVYDTRVSQTVCCMLDGRASGKSYCKKNRRKLLQDFMDRKLIEPTKQLHVYSNMDYATNKEFSIAFNELFTPVEKLQKQIDYHLQQLGNKYISISFRFTTLLGDFTDCTGTPLSPEERSGLIERCMEAIKTISRQAPAHDKILVTADSETFLSRAKEMENVYVIPGKVGHIDYDHGDDVNMKTFLDFFLISKAEKVYLARTGGMYRSAFAKTAAMVNDRQFEMYEF